MLNLVLTIIIAYYLIRTGDLFKLLRKGRKFIGEFFVSLRKEQKSFKTEKDPLEILKIRYAQGEISQKEYEQMKVNL